MKVLAVHIRSAGIFILALTYLISVFFPWPWLNLVIMGLLMLIVFLAVTDVKGPSRIIGYTLLAAGAVLLGFYRAPLAVWGQALSRNLYLVVMFSLVPLLGIPIRRGGYMDVLQGFFGQYVRKNHHFYLLIKIITFLVAVMINVAVIPLIYQMSLASEKSKHTKLLATAIIRGFAASVLWAPSYAAVALIIELTGAQWLQFFPYGLVLGTIFIIYGWLIVWLQEKSGDINADHKDGYVGKHATQHINVAWGKIGELIFFGAALIGTVVFVSVQTEISTVIVVALISLVYPLLWLAAIRRLGVFWAEFKQQYFGQNLPKLKNEVVLFLSAGFFSTAVNFSQLGLKVPQLLHGLLGDSSFGLTLLVLSAVTVTSMAGVHPIITVTILGSTLQPSAYHISANLMALLLTASWSLGVTVSPSSGINIAMSGQVDHSPLDIGPRWNGAYIAALLLLTLLVINGFNALGLL